MKKYLLFTLLLFGKYSFAQTSIQDNANNGQLKRMTLDQWDDWQPSPNTDWLGLPYNIEGYIYWRWLHHDYWDGDDLRPLKSDGPYTQHLALIAAHDPIETAYMNYLDSIKSTNEAEYSNMSGSELDVIYTTYYSSVFQDLVNDYTTFCATIPSRTLTYMATKNFITDYTVRQSMFNERVQAIHTSYMTRGARMLAYMKIETEWDKYLLVFKKTTYSIGKYLDTQKK